MSEEQKQGQLLQQVDAIPTSNDPSRRRKGRGCKSLIFYGLFGMVAIVFTLLLLAVISPDLFLIVINILWLVLLGLVLIFLFLGVLVMIGMKNEAQRIISIMLEGSLSLIDLADFAKEVWKLFLEYVREFILFITPLIAGFVGVLLYIGLMYLYKWVGKNNDVTLFTVFLTFTLVVATSILNRPKTQPKNLTTWIAKVKDRFSRVFKDALEVIVFVFFITMDSTNLFFLPADLNVELHAQINDYNLMTKAFVLSDGFRITLSLIMLSILFEVIRKSIKLTITAIQNYQMATSYLEKKSRLFKTADVVKISFRQSVAESTDEMTKFVTFTTVLVLVFLIFPRLKLLTMVVASLAALVMDFVIPARLKADKGDDLISRIITKVFRL